MNADTTGNTAGAGNASSNDGKTPTLHETTKLQEPKRRSLSSYLTNRTKHRPGTPVPGGKPEVPTLSPKPYSNAKTNRSSFDLSHNKNNERSALDASQQPKATESFDLSTAILMSIQNKQQSEQQEKQREREQQIKKQNELLLKKQEQQRQQGAKFNQQQGTNKHKNNTHDMNLQNQQQRHFQPPLFKSRFQPHQERFASSSPFTKDVSPSTELRKSLSPKKVSKSTDPEILNIKDHHNHQRTPMNQTPDPSSATNFKSQKNALSHAHPKNGKKTPEDKMIHVSLKSTSVDVKSSQGTETFVKEEKIQADKALLEPSKVFKPSSLTQNFHSQKESFKKHHSSTARIFEDNEISSDAETEPSHSPLKPRKGRLIRGDQLSAEQHPRRRSESPIKVTISESYFREDSSDSELSDINDLEEDLTGLHVGSSILASSPVKPNFVKPPVSAPSLISKGDNATVLIKKEEGPSLDVAKWEKKLMENYERETSTDDSFTEPKALHLGKAVTKHAKHINRDPYGRSKLHQACIKGKLALVKQLVLEDGYSVNDQDHSGQSALHLAAANGHLDIVKFLVEHGCNINIKTKVEERDIPLMDACLELEYDIVKYLLENGADPFYVNSIGDTALRYMENKIAEDDYEKEDEKEIFRVIKLLKQHMKIDDGRDKTDLKIVSGAHSPALGEDEDEEIVLTPSERRRKRSITPFKTLEVENDEIKSGVTGNLQKHESPKDMRGKAHDKLLLHHTKKGVQHSDSSSDSDSSNEDLIFEVTDLGTKLGKNKLLKASQIGDYNYVGQYLQNGGRVDNRVFIAACENGHNDLINLYLGIGGADSNLKLSKRPGRPSILMVSCGKGHFETVKLLVESGANVNYKDEMGHTCVYYSQKGGNFDNQEYQYLKGLLSTENDELKENNLSHENDNLAEQNSAGTSEDVAETSVVEKRNSNESPLQVHKSDSNLLFLKNEDNQSLAGSKHAVERATENMEPLLSPVLQKSDDFKETQDFVKKSSPSVIIKKVKLNDHSSVPTKTIAATSEHSTKTLALSKTDAQQIVNSSSKSKDDSKEPIDNEEMQDEQLPNDKDAVPERPVASVDSAATKANTAVKELGNYLKDDEKIKNLAKKELFEHIDQSSGEHNHINQKTDAQLEEDEEYQHKIQEIKNKKKLEMLQQIKQYEMQKQAEQEEKRHLEKIKLAQQEEQKKKLELDQQLAKHRLIRSYYPLGLKNIFFPTSIASQTSNTLAIHARKILSLSPIYYKKFNNEKNKYVLDIQIMSICRSSLPVRMAKKVVEWKEIDFVWNFFKPLFLYVDEHDDELDLDSSNAEAQPEKKPIGLKSFDQSIHSTYAGDKIFQNLSEQIQFESAEKKLLYSLEMHWVKLEDVLHSLDEILIGVNESAEIKSLIEQKAANNLVEIKTFVSSSPSQTTRPSISPATANYTFPSAHLLSNGNSFSSSNIKPAKDTESDLHAGSSKVDKNESLPYKELPLKFRGRSALLINNIINPKPLW